MSVQYIVEENPLTTPLLVDGSGEDTGILTGRAGVPYVSVTSRAAQSRRAPFTAHVAG